MSQFKGAKGPRANQPRKKPRREDIARAIHAAKVRPFASLRIWREAQEAKEDTKEEVES
jgi:hypothetical protein